MVDTLLSKAIQIAMEAHKGQFDKSGMPYICHVMRVMEAGKTIDEKMEFKLNYLRLKAEGIEIG